jgi:hypothetical protein
MRFLVVLGEFSEGQNFSFPTLLMPKYDFDEEETSIGHEEAPIHPPRDCSTAGNTSAGHGGSHSNTGYAPVPDGLPAERQRRRYSMHNRPRRTRTIGQRRETLKEKVKLNSVVATKTEGGCKHKCLRDVDEKYILDQRYMAWGQKYEQRASWILQMLNAFYLRTEGPRRDKFKTKLDGVEVCNACYATALEYSQRQFKQLKVAHQVYGRVAAVHGNMCHLRERAKMMAARESFQVFVDEAGCT